MAQAVIDLEDVTLETVLQTAAGRNAMTCIHCGVCKGTCPYGDVMEYSPRRIIGMLRAGLVERVISSDSLLNCVACYACMTKCPRGIRITEALLPVVKTEVFSRLPDVPAELHKALVNTLRYGNPMGESPRKRTAWTRTSDVPIPVLSEMDGRPVDVLWIPECYTAYHPRGQDAARATAKLFQVLGIDFATLGNEEKCAGECARLLGERGLFDTLRDQNMESFAKYEFNRIVTSGTHAYDAFVYIYPSLGFDHPVEHTTPYFARLLKQLRPHLTRKLDYKVTYHDSCCLGRHNGLYTQPRMILDAIPGITTVEMPHNRENSICCGGGGGGMWLDTYYKGKGHERLSDRRVKEAVETGADVLAVSCPYEISRFEDSLKVLGHDKQMVVRDIVELIAEALEA